MSTAQSGNRQVQAQPLEQMWLIMYHKSPTSGRTVFLLQGEGVCQPTGLSPLAQFMAPITAAGENKVVVHTSPLLQHATEWLALEDDAMELEDEFCERVNVPGGPITVYLARFTSIDPPFAAAQHVDGRFIAFTEGRGLAPAELELLRIAYSVIMEG